MNTTEKVVLITGTSSGVGLQLAEMLSKEKGYKVYATVRDVEKATDLKEVASRSGSNLHILKLDVQSEESVTKAVNQIIQESHKIDILVNNAGFGWVRSLEQSSSKEIEEVMSGNFYGALRCIKAVLPSMREGRGGHILTISSVGGLVGQPLNEIYCAAKFALEGLIESLATYFEPMFNIKMTLVEPAGIRSGFVGRIMNHLQTTKAPLQEVYSPILQKYSESLQKRGAFDEGSSQTPSDVAKVILNAIQNGCSDLRLQTSEAAKTFMKEKLASDPTGNDLQKRIRKEFLSLD